MPRLKHAVTGSVVNVPDSLVADLGGEWRPLDTPEPEPEAGSDQPEQETPEPEPEAGSDQPEQETPEPEPEAGEARKKPVRAKK